MSLQMASPKQATQKDQRLHYFKQFLNFLWLRPENALLLAVRAQHYQATHNFFGPDSIDVSCGDGVFSFITFGGELSEKSDKFRAVKSNNIFRKGNDDVFDFFDESYVAEVIKNPAHFYQYGSDWKDTLLKKAARLNAYKSLLQHDNNKPLPLKDGQMSYVYSNSTYWVQNFDAHLRDLARITKSGGHVVLEMKTTKIREFTSAEYLPFMGSRFHEIIDAGRLSTWKGLRSKDEIMKIIEAIDGFAVRSVEPIYGGDFIKTWDIGLRPLFPSLSKLANNVSDEVRLSAKRDWCQIFYEMFSAYLANYQSDANSAAEFLLVLEKK